MEASEKNMNLVLHLLTHLFFALAAGLIAWLFWGHAEISFLTGFFGGFLIDLDHLIDYFIAFGPKFRLSYFMRGYYFLKNDKIYVLFHGWEYVILSVITLLVIRPSAEIAAGVWGLTLGAFFHLVADRYINSGMSYKAYSLFFRAWKKFELKDIITPEHYLHHQEMKRITEIK